MSDENDSKNVASTSKTLDINDSNSQSKQTKVFILSPDILKKLGISNKIPNLSSINSTETTPKKSSSTIVKNSETKVKNKRAIVSKNKKNKIETSDLDSSENDQNKTDNSVKNKLFSMLTTKNLEPTSSSSKNFIEQDTNNENVSNQLKAENVTEKTKAETKLLEENKFEEKKTNETNAHQINFDSSLTTFQENESKDNQNKGRKRKSIQEEIPLELSVRKSPRKRRLSNIHKDFVTEFKFHNNSSKKILYESKETVEDYENKIIENNNSDIEQEKKTNESVEQPNNSIIKNSIKFKTQILDTENQNSENKDLNTKSLPTVSTNNLQLNLSPNGGPQSPKKHFVIHENILIKSPKTNNGDNSNRISPEKININKTVQAEIKTNENEFSVKVPVHQYRRKRKVVISFSDKNPSNNTDSSSPKESNITQNEKETDNADIKHENQQKTEEKTEIKSDQQPDTSKIDNNSIDSSVLNSVSENDDRDVNTDLDNQNLIVEEDNNQECIVEDSIKLSLSNVDEKENTNVKELENTQKLNSTQTENSVESKKDVSENSVTNLNESDNFIQSIVDENAEIKTDVIVRKRPGRPKKVNTSINQQLIAEKTEDKSGLLKKEQNLTITNLVQTNDDQTDEKINMKASDLEENLLDKNNSMTTVSSLPTNIDILLQNDKIISANLQCDIKEFITRVNEISKEPQREENDLPTTSTEFDVDILNKTCEINFDSDASSKSDNDKTEIDTKKTMVKEEISTPIKKKRGRPKKNPSTSNLTPKDDQAKPKVGRPKRSRNLTPVDTNLSDELENKEKRSGRPKKAKTHLDETESTTETQNKSDDEYSDSNSPVGKKLTKTGPRKKTGRKARAALFLGSDDTDPNDELKKSQDGIEEKASDTVTCAICNENILKSSWNNHTLKHNFLCWQVGKPEIDLNDRKLLESILFKKVKNCKTFKYFTCPLCGDQKKSVLGFLTHREICQKTPEELAALMATCPECGKEMRKASIKYHTHKLEKENILTECKNVEDKIDGRSKRKSAVKAENLIQEVSSQETAVDDSKKPFVSKAYKRFSDPSSVFVSNGNILKLQSELKKGPVKCKFKCSSVFTVFEDIKKHLYNCPALSADDYVCKICYHVEKNEVKIKHHMQLKHSRAPIGSEKSGNEESDESYDDASDDDVLLDDKGNRTVKSISEYSKPSYRIYFLACERKMKSTTIATFLPALKWMNIFCKENYYQQLFEDIQCCLSDWTEIPLNEQTNYLPRFKKSMSVASCLMQRSISDLQQQEHVWKEYSLYETDLKDDIITIFCGGPIWAISWAPTPYDSVSDQYLAISLQKDFETTYNIGSSYSGQEVIQFWSFGPLQNTNHLETKPNLVFSLAHNHGMVWCMEWCPSGFYNTTNPDDTLKKIGLLALACSDGTIPIYAIATTNHKPSESVNTKKMYKMKPVFKLISQEDGEQKLGLWDYQVTKLSWSKAAPHNIIAGGYSNGMVCLWDLTNGSPLLKFQQDGVTVLRPYQYFQAHTSAVSALDLFSLIDEGKRWLMTGSWDRSYKYWDLNNTSCPITLFGKRGVVTDGVWLRHWLCTYFAYDDAFHLGQNVTTVQNPREFGFKQCSALAANSVVTSLSANDWANAIAQGNLAGELAAAFPRNILVSYDVDKYLKCKRMLFSYNELIDKTKNLSERKDVMRKEKSKKQNQLYENDDLAFFKHFANSEKPPYDDEPRTYQKASKKYGLIFCDFNLNKFDSLPPESVELVKQSSRLREVPTELYPLTSLNRVQWNPNKQAYLYLASGYQNGFARIKCVRFMVPKIFIE